MFKDESPDGEDEGDHHQGDEDDGADEPNEHEQRLLLFHAQQQKNVDENSCQSRHHGD